jgi:hypothetical protein
VCNICNPASGDPIHMSIHAALRHEQKSAQHARNKESDTMWWNPISGEDAAVWNAPLEVREQLRSKLSGVLTS